MGAREIHKDSGTVHSAVVPMLLHYTAIVLTVSYTSIIIFLYRQKSQIHGLAPEAHVLRARENRRVTGMLVVIVVVFFSVWIPHYISVFLYFLKPETQVSMFYHLVWPLFAILIHRNQPDYLLHI